MLDVEIPWKKILLGIFVLWLGSATAELELSERQIKLLQNHLFVRVIVVFITAYLALDLGKHKTREKIFSSALITVGYGIIAEI